jgi:uncharacterized RmlC-like cupin family protein
MPTEQLETNAAKSATDWRTSGIRVVKSGEKSGDTPETQGMNRMVAISGERTGSTHLWAGTNRIEPGASTGPHHHGALESIIYVVRGTALMRWGTGWSSSPRRGRATSCWCLRMYRTRR